MRITVPGALIFWVIMGTLVGVTSATAEEGQPDGVATGTIAFAAGKAVPSLEHPFFQIRSVETTIAKPNLQTGKQKIGVKMIVDNSGEKGQKAVITVALLGGDKNILDAVAVKGNIDDSETFKVKFNMLRQHVKLVQSIRFEVSSQKD